MSTTIELSGLLFAQYGEGHLSDFVFKSLFSRYNLPGEGYSSITGSKITWQVCGLIGLPSTCPYKSRPERMIYNTTFTYTVAKSLSGLEPVERPFLITKNSVGVRPLTHFEGNLEWALNGCELLPNIGWLVDSYENDPWFSSRSAGMAESIRIKAKNVYPERDAVIGFVTEELVGAIEFRQRIDRTHYKVDLWALTRVLDGSKIIKPAKLYFPLDETGHQTLLLGELC